MNASATLPQESPSAISVEPRVSSPRSMSSHAVTDAAMERWYRWGWVPLVAGCLLIALGVFGLWTFAMAERGGISDATAVRAGLARDLLTTILLASWAGWFVLRSRRRILDAQLELREREASLIEGTARARELAGIGALSRIVAHEIRNPLNSLMLHCRLLDRRLGLSEGATFRDIHDALSQVKADASRLERLASEYLAYTRCYVEHTANEPVELDALVSAAAERFQHGPYSRRIQTATWCGGDAVRVRGDLAALRQMLDALLRFVVSATPTDGKISVATDRDGPDALLTITLQGRTFDRPEALFRAFYTDPTAGASLALSIVRDTVRAHGGEVLARNLDGANAAEITVRLPEGAAP